MQRNAKSVPQTLDDRRCQIGFEANRAKKPPNDWLFAHALYFGPQARI
jgi:hypothetical protein